MKQETKEEIKTLTEEIEELKIEKEKLENGENAEEYNAMLDDCNQGAEIGSITFEPSRILKELDEIAYNVGLNDFNDERLSEIENEIDEKKEELKELQK